jgi:hypothetical protein
VGRIIGLLHRTGGATAEDHRALLTRFLAEHVK